MVQVTFKNAAVHWGFWGLQITRYNAWELAWTPEHRWRFDVRRNNAWVNIWHWDRRERLFPAFAPHPSIALASEASLSSPSLTFSAS